MRPLWLVTGDHAGDSAAGENFAMRQRHFAVRHRRIRHSRLVSPTWRKSLQNQILKARS